MILGLTGTICSGKSEIASYLKEKGFKYLTLSDLIREEAKKRNMPIEREILQDIGNELRKEQGNGYWAGIAKERIDPKQKWVIDGIRNTGEIDELRKLQNFFLIGVDAPREVRIIRIEKRKRVIDGRIYSDPDSKEEFKKVESRDRGLGEPEHGQQVLNCLKKADFLVMNDTTISKLQEKIEEILTKIYPKRSYGL